MGSDHTENNIADVNLVVTTNNYSASSFCMPNAKGDLCTRSSSPMKNNGLASTSSPEMSMIRSCNVILKPLTDMQRNGNIVSLANGDLSPEQKKSPKKISNSELSEEISPDKSIIGPAGLNGSYWDTPALPSTSVSRWKLRREGVNIRKQKLLVQSSTIQTDKVMPRKRKRSVDEIEEEDKRILECHGPKRKCHGDIFYSSKQIHQSSDLSKHVPSVGLMFQNSCTSNSKPFAELFSKEIDIPKISSWMMGTTATKKVPYQNKLILSRDAFIEYRRNQSINDTSSETSSVTSSHSKPYKSHNSSRGGRRRRSSSSACNGQNTPQKDAAEKSSVEFERLRRILFEKRHPGCFDRCQATNERLLVLNEADLKDSQSPFLTKEMIAQSKINDKIPDNFRDLTPLFVSHQVYNDNCKSCINKTPRRDLATSEILSTASQNSSVISLVPNNKSSEWKKQKLKETFNAHKPPNSNTSPKTIPNNVKRSPRRKLKLLSYARSSGDDGTDSDSIELCNKAAKAYRNAIWNNNNENELTPEKESGWKGQDIVKKNSTSRIRNRYLKRHSSAGSFIKRIIQNGGILPDNVM